MSNRVFRIHPAIGFARVGTSEDFYLAPETLAGHPVPDSPTTGGLPIRRGTESDAIRDTDLRDSQGNLKRQAARFRIYGYETPAGGESYPLGDAAKPVEIQIGSLVDGKKVTDIVWTVHLANKKSGWYESDDDRGIIAYNKNQTPPLRNANLTPPTDPPPSPSGDPNDPQRWKRLFTDPGPRAIRGTTTGPVKFDIDTVASYGDGGTITEAPNYPKTFPQDGFNTPLYPPDKPIKTLGELQTDKQGRLIVVAAYGLANSFNQVPPKYGWTDAVNNDWWFDDTGDGPVTASLVFEDGSTAEVQGHGWVVSTDPAYAPQILNAVSLWDDIYDSWVRKLGLNPALYKPGPPQSNPLDNFQKSYTPSFDDEVRPIFLAAGLQRWITNLSVLGITAHQNIESITADVDPASTQLAGLGFIRVPVDPENLAVSAPVSGDDRRMPLSLGDAGRGLLSLSYTQYFFLQQWDAAKATKACIRLGPGELLDKAALVAGLGGRFSPGIDMTYISREPDLYVQNWQTSGMGPFRINLKPVNYTGATKAPVLSLGWIPRRNDTGGLEPGDVSKFMAIPWHADYNSCATHLPSAYTGSDPQPPADPSLFKNPEFNNTLYWSWPAQRPVAVYKASDVKDGKTLPRQVFSVRGPGTKTELAPGQTPPPFGPADPAEVGRYQSQTNGPGIARILDNWMKIGTVIQSTNINNFVNCDPPVPLYLEVQSLLPDTDSDTVQPWPNTVRPETNK
jgi:hypothetical protein